MELGAGSFVAYIEDFMQSILKLVKAVLAFLGFESLSLGNLIK